MTISRCFNLIIMALLAAMASSFALAAAPPAVQLVAQKTTATPAGNACPKTYTFTFRLRSNMDGPAQYHFVFSDGSQIAPQSINLKRGQNFELSTNWTLSANMKGAWAGVQFGDGAEMHGSTFSMTCSTAIPTVPGGMKNPSSGPVKTPVAVNQQKCPVGTRPGTVVYNS